LAKAHKIESAVVSLYRVPLDEVLIDSAHGVHSHFDLAIVKLTTDDGIEGYGYTAVVP
jgi:L-alanine-DL-glutamate epimerase-like enolase superfamily enzyme